MACTDPAALWGWLGDDADVPPAEYREILDVLRARDSRKGLMELGALDPSISDVVPVEPGQGGSLGELNYDLDRDAVVPSTGKTASALWRVAVGKLQTGMTRAFFDTWVRDAELLSFQEGEFVIGVYNDYAREWLEDRLKTTARRVLTGIVGYPVEIRFVVRQEV